MPLAIQASLAGYYGASLIRDPPLDLSRLGPRRSCDARWIAILSSSITSIPPRANGARVCDIIFIQPSHVHTA